MCWCSGGGHCSIGEHFRTDFGTLTIIGPSPLDQDKTCVAGQTCSVESGLSGTHLSYTNLFAVLDTCGVPQNFPVLRWSPDQAVTMASFTGGQYRLCWCVGELEVMIVADPSLPLNSTIRTNTSLNVQNLSSVLMNTTYESPCRTADDYRVDFGGLLLVGATPIYNDFTCISGQRCELGDVVTGVHVQDEDLNFLSSTETQKSSNTLPEKQNVSSHSEGLMSLMLGRAKVSDTGKTLWVRFQQIDVP